MTITWLTTEVTLPTPSGFNFPSFVTETTLLLLVVYTRSRPEVACEPSGKTKGES